MDRQLGRQTRLQYTNTFPLGVGGGVYHKNVHKNKCFKLFKLVMLVILIS